MDNWVLYSPQGSAYNLASILRADPGPDFGRVNLPAAALVANPYSEGAQLAYETAGPRRMTFPVRLASGMLGLSLDRLDSALITAARPGAYIDLQPDSVPSNQAVRFDVITGRVTSDRWSVYIQRAARREVTLELDVMPFGYWPTWITLASGASIGLPGRLSIPAASIVGDAPGFARLVVQPTTPTSFAAGSWVTDMLAWGLGGQASFVGVIGAGQLLTGISPASMVNDQAGLASQRLDLYPAANQGGWTTMAYLDIATVIEPAYRGRYRAFVLARPGEPSSLPWFLSVDAVGGLQTTRALASAQPIATVAWDSGPSGISASPAFQIVDAGELTLPLAASGQTQAQRIRVWMSPPTSNVGIVQPLFSIGGLCLIPLDGGAGILPRGLAQPSLLTPSVGRFAIDSEARTAVVAGLNSDLSAGLAPLGDAFAYYQGDLPKITPSTVGLDLLAGQRKAASGATAPLAWTARSFGAVSVAYQPRFQFMKGV